MHIYSGCNNSISCVRFSRPCQGESICECQVVFSTLNREQKKNKIIKEATEYKFKNEFLTNTRYIVYLCFFFYFILAVVRRRTFCVFCVCRRKNDREMNSGRISNTSKVSCCWHCPHVLQRLLHCILLCTVISIHERISN